MQDVAVDHKIEIKSSAHNKGDRLSGACTFHGFYRRANGILVTIYNLKNLDLYFIRLNLLLLNCFTMQ